MSSIRLSENHGVNPSLGLCFWCGEEDGTLLLLGRLPNDAEAPRKVCASYEPCDKCTAGMAQGITLMEATQDGPTGRYVVLKEQAILQIFEPGETREATLQKRKAYMHPTSFNQILRMVLAKRRSLLY